MAFDLDDDELKATRELNGVGTEKIIDSIDKMDETMLRGLNGFADFMNNIVGCNLPKYESVEEAKGHYKKALKETGMEEIEKMRQNNQNNFMSEEEIIKNAEKYVELINKEYCDECNELNVISGKYCNGSRNVAMSIQGLLDLYQQEKEKNKKLEEEKEAFARSYVQASDNEAAAVIRSINQKDFYEKVIDMMEQDLLHYNEKQVNMELIVATANGDTIKEYYFKKARKNKL